MCKHLYVLCALSANVILPTHSICARLCGAISRELQLCRVNLHPTSILVLLKCTSQGLMHSSRPPYPSPLRTQLHSSWFLLPCPFSCSCASLSSLRRQGRETLHQAITHLYWPFVLSINSQAAHTPTQTTYMLGNTVLSAGLWLMDSEPFGRAMMGWWQSRPLPAESLTCIPHRIWTFAQHFAVTICWKRAKDI